MNRGASRDVPIPLRNPTGKEARPALQYTHPGVDAGLVMSSGTISSEE